MADTSITLDIVYFRTIYPQFTDPPVTDEVLEAVFEIAADFVGNPGKRKRMPLWRRRAAIYALMCHLLTLWLQNQSGAPGPLTSAKEGTVSTGFYVPAYTTDNYLKETPCGRQFLLLMASDIYGGLQFTPHDCHPWG